MMTECTTADSPPRILSLCIATYGQPRQIKRTLDSLLRQDLNEVEIVIRDDSPTAETELVVAEYATKLPIRYFHMNKEGVDRAFLFLSKEACGDFVWWFGDDFFCPGTIGDVVNLLRRNPCLDFMYINSTDMSEENYSIPMTGSRFFRDRNEVLFEIKDQLGFCSAMLFGKKILASGLSQAERFIGTSWVTFFLALNTLAAGKTFYFFDGKNFISESKPPGESRWYEPFDVHGINFFVVAQEFKEKFDRKILRKVQADKFGHTWRAVLVERGLGFTSGFANPSPKIRKMAKYFWKFPEFYVAMPLMLLPKSILRISYPLFKGIRSLARPESSLSRESYECPGSESVEEIPIICPQDRAVLFRDNAMLYHCPVCLREFQVEGGVVRLVGRDDEFYEGAYEGQVKFVPRSERPWHIWPLWLINSGFPWLVRRYVPKDGVVVELGCAGGVKYFGKRYHMIGCDLSFKSLLKTEGIYRQLLQTDVVKSIPLPDNSVDAVVSSFFWEHIDPALKPKLLAECLRILRPEGKIIFLYDVETNNPAIHHYKEINPTLYKQLFIEGDGHVGYQRPVENLSLFQSAGYRVLEHRGLEKTWLQSPSTFGKLTHFGKGAKIMFGWTKVFGNAPWFYVYTALMRLVDTIICPWLPKDYARIDLVILEKKSS